MNPLPGDWEIGGVGASDEAGDGEDRENLVEGCEEKLGDGDGLGLGADRATFCASPRVMACDLGRENKLRLSNASAGRSEDIGFGFARPGVVVDSFGPVCRDDDEAKVASNESPKPLETPAAGLLEAGFLSLCNPGKPHASAIPLLAPFTGVGPLAFHESLPEIDASPDLWALAGFTSPQGFLSTVSMRLRGSSASFRDPFVGLDGLPRRIGAIASNTFSRA